MRVEFRVGSNLAPRAFSPNQIEFNLETLSRL